MRLRGNRGSERVRAIGADPSDAEDVVRAALGVAASALTLPSLRIEWSARDSIAHPGARGRYLAGVVTLFPAALADPLTLAWTVLHELAHAAGLDEAGADAFAQRVLAGEPA